MDERELVAFLLRELLRDVFGTKSDMARELGIPLRTLQWNFQTLDTQKGARVSYQRLIAYCAEREIDLTPYFHKFQRQKGSAAVNGSRMPRTERIGGRDMDAIFARMYEMMETLLSEVCAQCKRTGGESGKCAVKQYAEMINQKRMETDRTKGDERMKNGEISILRWMFLEMRREYFQNSNTIMAEKLEIPEEDIRRATEEGWRLATEVFEKAAQYCLHNGLSLDSLLKGYPAAPAED